MSRVALVHDWLVAHRGGEQVLLELARLFPSAPIFTLVFDASRVHPELAGRDVHTSFIQRLPGAPERFRQYLPLFPRAVEALELGDFELVVSTSHCVAKGARAPGTHLAYVHTPMRYVWDQLEHYLPPLLRRRAPARRAAEALVTPLRRWDVASSRRPSRLLANSAYVRARIRRFWDLDAHVVHPPVDVERFAAPAAPARARRGFLVVSALVPYKRVELAVAWASRARQSLTVVGDGPEAGRLRRLAGPTVRFERQLTDEELRGAYATARALLFCGVEDFGIVPVEAQAAGCPVVALAEGGALETVVDGETGVLFAEPTLEALTAAIGRLEALELDEARLRANARRFGRERFSERMRAHLTELGHPLRNA